ncbi:uncharacterized protein Z518_00228 [Rhinocladiella mackenziei CBS 650.93]|uniref:Rhinocladiella mackenziei CBS 650.93 unplaced genomic scaffold supercont1.1, whole genome shotgun sequence n=1 Tax=Rhinocladiella mackenziei CBS 650.93 TaxID=1442369 RepID=A0A0D2JIC2_9EURO|nr:uncharacterized protein Z518_00228 [Rhinocladiella mackenziei CBS 650.93]KIX09150.1 hypothetical protein Z518_00228 [Rhinocladiella mackenziei CBS 650.93]
MAFSNTLSGRMEELRFPSLRSPDTESPFNSNASSTRDQNPFFSNIHTSSNDARASLQRRFTTDSSKMPVARPFGQQYNSINPTASNPYLYPRLRSADLLSHFYPLRRFELIMETDYNPKQVKNKQMYDDIQSAKRKAEEQLRLLELQERSLQMGANSQDLERISTRLNRISLNGPVSEPTTPPEYAESGFSHRFSRSSRLSVNSVISPPGLSKRMSQSSSQITSPPGNRLSGNGIYSQSQKPSAKSVPGSRRGSDEDEYYPEDLPTTRAAATLNRFSMPVNSSRHPQRLSLSGAAPSSFSPTNTTSFLFDEDDDKHLSLNAIDLKSPVAKAFAQLEGDDTFPTLTSDGLKLSANSAALDLANSRTPDLDWTLGSRYRPAHQSMPHTDSSMYRPVLSNLNISSPPADRPADLTRRKSQRHSLGVTFEDNSPLPSNLTVSRPTSLQTSYSSNDVPTVKKSLTLDSIPTPPKTQAEQQFHNHNVSLGRIPANAMNNRQSREIINGAAKVEDKAISSAPPMSNLHASAAPFSSTYSAASDPNLTNMTSLPAAYPPAQPYVYNMQSYNVNQMNPQAPVGGSAGAYGQNQGVFGMNSGYNAPPPRAGTGRRNHGDEARFNNVPLETYRGSLYELCKDQHGCRYLQRKLEDGDEDHAQAIFVETCPHIIELMTDPFGNYLCQKLFEHCNEEQRTTLINTASPALTTIALNQHGTRALQKMIEFVHTPEQVDTIIQALSGRVVELVQDLNGNHVVQKCLTRLGAERSQFIYDAVGKYCVVVGTHRHGCCVLQRCIDHAQGFQRAQLIARITHCAFDLVQDPFGNYVVQYILDLDEAAFTKPLCESFFGRVPALSKQKFSSNVIEKCLRTADSETKEAMIDEMLRGNELEKMLRDSFANYVVQTAMEFADPPTKIRLVDAIRPILPLIKQTPHGRRIASKILSNDAQVRSNGPLTSNDALLTRSNRRAVQIVGGGFNVRTPNGYDTGDMSTETIPSNGNGYGMMHHMTTNSNDSTVNMYNAPYANELGQNGYTGYINRSGASSNNVL